MRCWSPSSTARKGRLAESIFYRRLESTKTCSIGALTCRFSAFAANWSTTRARHRLSRPSEALDMCSPGRSKGFERGPVGADFASGSPVTLAPRLTVAVRDPGRRLELKPGVRDLVRRARPTSSCVWKSRCGCDRSAAQNMRTVLSVDESGVDPGARGRLDAPLDRVAHAQFVPDLPKIHDHPCARRCVGGVFRAA